MKIITRLKAWFQNLTVPKNEFHPSLSINPFLIGDMNVEEDKAYRARILERRKKAHARDLGA